MVYHVIVSFKHNMLYTQCTVTFLFCFFFYFSPLSLGPNHLLLRGAMLRNTSWVCSVVIYTGHETKLMMNQTSAPLKRSTVDKIVNTQIIMLFLLLCSLCLLSSFCNIIWTNRKGQKDWYLQLDGKSLLLLSQ